jgi:hypothetical protein
VSHVTLAERVLRREPLTAAAESKASDLRALFLPRYADGVADVAVVCRPQLCEVQLTLRDGVQEKSVVNYIAADRTKWSVGFATVDYASASPLYGRARFLLSRDAKTLSASLR